MLKPRKNWDQTHSSQQDASSDVIASLHVHSVKELHCRRINRNGVGGVSFLPVDFIHLPLPPTSIPFCDWKVIYFKKKVHAAENQAQLLLAQQEHFKVNRAQMRYQKYPMDDAAAMTAIPSVFHTSSFASEAP